MLAREGYIPIACMLVLSVAAWLVFGMVYALAGALATAYVVRLHFIIPRRISTNSLDVLSAVSGRVCAVEPVRDLVSGQDATLIATSMRFPGIAPIRSPVDGKVVDFKVDCQTTVPRVSPGSSAPSAVEPSSGVESGATAPERPEHKANVAVADPIWEAERSPNCYVVTLETDTGERISYAIRSRGRQSRFRSKFAPGERVARGKFCGFVYFGSVCEIILPTNVDPRIAVGKSVRAGSTTIARLIHS